MPLSRDRMFAASLVNFFIREEIRLAVEGCDRMLVEESPLETLEKQVGDAAASAMSAG